MIQLEEALRDGVILAKVTRVFSPHLVRRIFESPRLQFRHSENINYFFQFLDEIGIPDLFTFELTDLYDKKNIPKVIYCVHALSFILSNDDLAPAIGDLVGKLEFTDDEIKATQRGLDANGLNLPNFKGMNKHFGQPDPEPEVSEEQIMAMKLRDCEGDITEFQARCRGALFRLDYHADKYVLNKTGHLVIELQAIVRGENFREKLIRDRRIQKSTEHQWVPLQALCKGALTRQSIEHDLDVLRYIAQAEIIALQARIRGANLRAAKKDTLNLVLGYGSTEWANFQACARGYLLRQKKRGLKQVIDSQLDSIMAFQGLARGVLIRTLFEYSSMNLQDSAVNITHVQSILRGNIVRRQLQQLKDDLLLCELNIETFQSRIRGQLLRQKLDSDMNEILDSEKWVEKLQGGIRGYLFRMKVSDLKERLSEFNHDTGKFQQISQGYLIRRQINSDKVILESEESKILALQSLFRAGRLRSAISKDFERLDLITPSIIRLQSIFRGLMVRFNYTLMLDEFEDELPSMIDLQAVVRGHIIRKSFNDRMKHFNQNMDKVIKIQSYVRAKKQGDAYKSLTSGSNPPLSTVKSFVHLLNDSDLDFEQEVELEHNRKRVIDEVRNNETLEQYITQLDVKIALLLKNKITLDELVRHRNKGASLQVTSPGDIFDLKALNKSSRRRLELYQGLFYIIQTQPAYLARLFRKLKEKLVSEKEIKDLEGLVMMMYGYGQKRREEFFLLQLIGRSIKEDIDYCDSTKSFIRGNYIWWKLAAAINRHTKERKFLKELLGSVISPVVDRPDLDLESDPLAIYRSSINNEELRTGRLSQRDPNLPVDEAIQDPEARAKFISNLQQLRELTTQFVDQIECHVDGLPYHVRYFARMAYESFKRKADIGNGESEDRLLGVVGHFIFTNYLNPAIVACDNFGIVKTALGPLQTRNLNEIIKMLSQIASLKPFSKDNVYLQPLNDYVKTSIARMKNIFERVIDVPDLEVEYEMSVFDDLTSHRRPTLYIKSSDIFALHSLICQELDSVTIEPDDSLRDVIIQLGNLPNDASEILNIARFTEIKLDLNPSFCKVEDPEAEINSLFVAAKRCLVYILRVQTGSDLLDVLVLPVLPEHEEKYKAILKEERMDNNSGKEKQIAYAEAGSLGDLSKITYRELKLLALEKIIELESYGKISRDGNYQEILNSIATDIRTKRNRRVARQKEMKNIRQTLSHLSEKESYLKNQLQTYNNYIEQAMNTLQSKKGTKRKSIILPFTKQYFHLRDLQKSGRVPKFGSYKYTAANLFEKKILIRLDGYPERQYSQVSFTFSSDQVGVFNVEAAYGSIVLPGASTDVTLDDLLGQQYNNLQYFSLFDDMVHFNTNLLLHFIFKKFYGEG